MRSGLFLQQKRFIFTTKAVYFYNKSGIFLQQKRYIFIPFNSETRFSEKRGSPKFRLKQCLMIIACLITFAK
jgi:hypothetical protein